MSCSTRPIRSLSTSITQSATYCTEPAPAAFTACAGRIIAVLAVSSVTNFMSTMAASTVCARRCGAVRVVARREPRRRAHQAGEHGGFRDGELLRRLAEIALRRRLDAVGAGAEIDAVEIELDDLGLAELAFQPQRQRHLLHLAGEGALLGQEQVLGELLRDGRAALRHAAPHHVGVERARHADRVDAAMRIEAAVLDGDERLRHVARQFLERNRIAVVLAPRGEQPAVEVDDLDRRRTLGDFQRLDRRQIARRSRQRRRSRRSPATGSRPRPNRRRGRSRFVALPDFRPRRFFSLSRRGLRRRRLGVGRKSACGPGPGVTSKTGSRRSLAFRRPMSRPQQCLGSPGSRVRTDARLGDLRVR